MPPRSLQARLGNFGDALRTGIASQPEVSISATADEMIALWRLTTAGR